MSDHQPEVDLNSLRFRLYAEFDNWPEFVAAAEEFQRLTCIQLTITTSRKMKAFLESRPRGREEEQKEHARFEYHHLKLTCKHFGSYRSISKGIRRNQKTAKLQCPTYIYACYDPSRKKFIIKQMVVDCNHELREEDVVVSKLFRGPSDSPGQNGEEPVKKKYKKTANRNVLKVPIPIDASNPHNYPTTPTIRIRCNHINELSDTCEAASLTSEDLQSIYENFASKTKEKQDQLILDWVKVIPFFKTKNTVQALFQLPTFDDTLVRVCYKAFSQVLKISFNRINELINDHYDEKGSMKEKSFSNSTGAHLHGVNEYREIENSIANILTSFSKDDQDQVIYCDTVDVPYDESVDHSYNNTSSMTGNTTGSPGDGDENDNIVILDTSMVSSKMNDSHDMNSLDKSHLEIMNNLKPPGIKLSPVENGFALEIDCEFSVNLKAINVDNSGKSLRVFFNSKI